MIAVMKEYWGTDLYYIANSDKVYDWIDYAYENTNEYGRPQIVYNTRTGEIDGLPDTPLAWHLRVSAIFDGDRKIYPMTEGQL